MKTALKRWEFWVSVIILTISLGMLIFAVYYSANIGRKFSSFVQMDATIVEYKLEMNGTTENRKSNYFTIVEYEVDGKIYRAKDKMSSVVIGKEGSLRKIAYNPDNPAECVFVHSERSLIAFLFAFTVCLIVMGTAVAAVFARDLKRIKLMNTYANAQFITSAASKTQFITADKPIIAVCGKSNVGKSSFINMLAGQKKLAKVSQEPGRTRLINYFDFGSFVLADLPGYGYARVSKAEKAKWARLLDDFFADSGNIAHVIALCDIRHNPTADDMTMLEFLYARTIPFTIVATKADKLSRAQAEKSLSSIASVYGVGRKDIIPVSSKTRQGFSEIIEEIHKVIELNK